MNDERKYSVVGRVEIGTDEYRDLIETSCEWEKTADNYRDKFWREQERTNDLSKKLKTAEAELESMRAYLHVLEALDAYEHFKAEQKEGAKE